MKLGLTYQDIFPSPRTAALSGAPLYNFSAPTAVGSPSYVPHLGGALVPLQLGNPLGNVGDFVYEFPFS